MAELLLMPTGLPPRVCVLGCETHAFMTRRLQATDPHAVPPPTHYTGVTQTADTVSNLFAHKMFTKFRTVKRAFQLVQLLPFKGAHSYYSATHHKLTHTPMTHSLTLTRAAMSVVKSFAWHWQPWYVCFVGARISTHSHLSLPPYSLLTTTTGLQPDGL